MEDKPVSYRVITTNREGTVKTRRYRNEGAAQDAFDLSSLNTAFSRVVLACEYEDGDIVELDSRSRGSNQ